MQVRHRSIPASRLAQASSMNCYWANNMSPLSGTDPGQSQPPHSGGRTRRRRSQYLSATTLARPAAWLGWPAALVAVPLALAPSHAGATTFSITAAAGCGFPPGCNAVGLIPSPGAATDTIAFSGGGLNLNGIGLTYAQKGTFAPLVSNVINQDGHDTTLSGVFSGTGSIEIANTGIGGSVTFTKSNTYSGATKVDFGATLKLSGNRRINSSALEDNGVVDASGASGNISLKSLSGSKAATLNLGANSLSMSAAAGTFSGWTSWRRGYHCHRHRDAFR